MQRAQPASCAAFHWAPALGWLLGGAEAPYVLAAKLRWPPSGDFHKHGPDLVDPLTKEELVSLEWVSAGTPRVVIPAAHIENLLAAG
jgi:hypothetical protein